MDMAQPKEIIGRRLTEISEMKGISQADVARETKLDVVTINRIFNGKQGVRDTNLRLILKALKTKPEEFLQEKPPSKPFDFTSAASFLSEFGDLESDLQKVVLAIVYHDLDYAKDLSPEFQSKFEPLLKVL